MGVSPGSRMHPGREHRAEKSVEFIPIKPQTLTELSESGIMP
jgi:hypothetical protein